MCLIHSPQNLEAKIHRRKRDYIQEEALISNSNMNKLIKGPSLKQNSSNYILNIQRPATAVETAKEGQKVISPRFTKTDSK